MAKTAGFTRETAERILAVVEEIDGGARSVGVSRAASTQRSVDTYYVAITSTTKVSGRYPGKRYTYDTITSTWTEQDDIWVIEANGHDLTVGPRYAGLRNAIANDRPVWVVDAPSVDMTTPLAASSPITLSDIFGTLYIGVAGASYTQAGVVNLVDQVMGQGDKSFYGRVIARGSTGLFLGYDVSGSTADYFALYATPQASLWEVHSGSTSKIVQYSDGARMGLALLGTGAASFPAYSILNTAGGSGGYIGIWHLDGGGNPDGAATLGYGAQVAGGIVVDPGTVITPVAGGGTGAATFTAGAMIFGNGTSAMDSAASTKVTSGELSLKGAAGKWVKVLAPDAY